MKSARAEDYWRHAFAREYAVRCDEVTYADLLGLGKGSVRFRSGVTAIVGANGVGKSTLVAAIAELLGGEAALKELDHLPRLKGSRLCGLVREERGEYKITIEQDGEQRTVEGAIPADVTFAWLDPAYQTAQSRRLVAKDAAFSEVLEPIGPRKLTDKELTLVRYVVGKSYESCTVYEVPEYGGIEKFPYFRVVADGIDYGSETMGQGELSLLFILWELLTIPKNSILLIEEPETHVSPRSQEALMNAIVQFAVQNGIWAIITTHSPSVVARLPKEHIRLLSRDGKSVLAIEGAFRYQLAAVLGGGGGYQGVVLVEDEIAKQFSMAILDELDPDLLRQYEIVDAISNSGISVALKSMPRTKEWFSLVGAFDGDQQGKVKDADKFVWPHTFLPGNASPESLFMEMARRLGIDAIAKEIGRTREAVAPVFEAAEGKDPHDWIHSVANGLGLGIELTVRVFTRMWLRLDGSVPSCKGFLDTLKVK
jgi:energy-coupling factor transporter ATP-binding protein EcfA2